MHIDYLEHFYNNIYDSLFSSFELVLHNLLRSLLLCFDGFSFALCILDLPRGI